jgi:glutamate dehydrogenase/leucine dehydrogenase
LLKNYYGTGGDLNVDEIHEVIPITEKNGLLHPQEGVVNGHFKVEGDAKNLRINNLRIGVSKALTDDRFSPEVSQKFLVADMITGFGVAEAVRHYYSIWGGNVNFKRAIIQGWGNVGAAAAYYLSLYGIVIVGIIDRNGGLLKPTGFTKEEIKDLFLAKQGNTLVHPDMMSYEEINEKIWEVGAEIFVPAAASRLVTQAQIEKMIDNDLEVISCGANVPFADQEIFLGPIANYTDDHVAIIPDYIANCGMARVFAYCMSNDTVDLSDEAIFKDTSKTIWQGLMRLHQFNPKHKGLLKKGLEMALVNLV